MKIPNSSLSIIAFIFILSCSEFVPDEYVNPCENDGKWTGTLGFGGTECDCPQGFCGNLCERPLEISLYGNYEGIMVCRGDSSATLFKVEEYLCDFWSTELLFNDGELTATYWKLWENTNQPWNVGDIKINLKGNEFWNPVNGRITPDSLSFWVLESENSPDTCFYVGVKI